MSWGAVPRWLGLPMGALLVVACTIQRGGLAQPDGSSDAGIDGQVEDAGMVDADDRVDAGTLPVLDSVATEVVAHGARLVIRGRNLAEVEQVEIGGVLHRPTVIDADQLIVADVGDMVPTGLGEVVAMTSTGRSNSLGVTVVHLVVSELDQQTDAGSDRHQFIEVTAGVSGVVLQEYSIVLYGSDGLSYRTLALSAVTNASGLLLAGTDQVTPSPALLLPPDAILDGPGAAVLHQGLPTDFPTGTMISAASVIDGLVFHRTDSPESAVLLDALFGAGPERVQVNENVNGREGSDSIQRCSRERLDGRAFVVAPATPGASNACEPPAP